MAYPNTGGISPQRTPPIMDPAMKPVQPTAQPTAAAARDVALRNLGTQTAAVPTAPQTSASPPAGTTAPTPTAETMTPGAAPQASQHVEQFLTSHPDAQPLVEAIHNAATPQDRFAAIRNLLASFNIMRHGPGPVGPGEHGGHDGGYGDAWDGFDRHDRNSAPSETVAPDGEAERLDAMRIKRQRQSRLG